MMNKYIRTIFLLNETVAFAAIKPFYNSFSHSDTPPFPKKILIVPDFRLPLGQMNLSPQKRNRPANEGQAFIDCLNYKML